MQILNLILAFILEVIALLGFAAVGFLIPIETLFQIISALLLLVLLIAFWGRFMSPKAPKRVNLATYYLIKYVLYIIAAFTIFRFYGQFESILFLAISLLNDCLLFKYNKSRF